MTRNDIAKKLLEVLPNEFLAKKGAQLSFDFAPPTSRGIKKAEEYVNVIMETIERTLMAGESVEISGFGKFIIRQKKERIGRNPKTRQEAIITARKVVSFKPSKILKDIVNGDQR